MHDTEVRPRHSHRRGGCRSPPAGHRRGERRCGRRRGGWRRWRVGSRAPSSSSAPPPPPRPPRWKGPPPHPAGWWWGSRRVNHWPEPPSRTPLNQRAMFTDKRLATVGRTTHWIGVYFGGLDNRNAEPREWVTLPPVPLHRLPPKYPLPPNDRSLSLASIRSCLPGGLRPSSLRCPPAARLSCPTPPVASRPYDPWGDVGSHGWWFVPSETPGCLLASPRPP